MTKDGELGWGLKRFGHVVTQPEPALSSVPRAAECAPLPAPEPPSRRSPFYKSLNRLFALIHQVIMLCPGWKGLEKVTKAEQFSAPDVVSSSDVFWRKQAEKLGGSRRPNPFLQISLPFSSYVSFFHVSTVSIYIRTCS